MALNGSGAISLGGGTSGQSIALELGLPTTSTISLNQSDVRGLAGVASGAIVMPTDFWGKANEFTFSFTSGANQNFRTLALAAGWDGASKVVGTSSAGNITSASTGSYAFTIDGAYPAGATFINQATIVGRGGGGGAGHPGNSPGAGQPGGSSGNALLVSSPVTIQNLGVIRAPGGGGGGGGGSGGNIKGQIVVARGGGGGGGLGNGTGGATNGQAGTLIAGGAGGGGASSAGRSLGGTGGAGGGIGSSGATGGGGSRYFGGGGGGAGGVGGKSIQGYSLISFTTVGTIEGPTAG